MTRQLYEGMFLFDSNLASRDWPGLERHVEELLKKNSAELVYSERWPDRKMAYEIKGCKKGTYYLTYFNASSGSLSALERDCQLSDRVLRLLVVREQGIEEDMEKRRTRRAEEASASPEETPRATEDAPARPAGATSSGSRAEPPKTVLEPAPETAAETVTEKETEKETDENVDS